MKRISRYLLREFAPLFFISFAFVVFLLSLGNLFQLVDLLTRNVLSLGVIFQYWLLSLLSTLPYGISLAVLISSALTFSRFSQDREFLALKSLGIPLPRTIVPLLLSGLLLSGLNLVLIQTVQPYSLYRTRVMLFENKLDPTEGLLKPGSVITEFPGLTIFIPNKSTNSRVTLYQKDADLVKTISARRIKGLRKAGRFYLYLEDGLIQTYQPGNQEVSQRLTFRTYLLPLPENDRQFRLPEPKLYEKTNRQLTLEPTPQHQAEKKRRFSFAATPFLFLLAGIPLGLAVPRSIWSVTAACGLVLGYYFTLSGLDALVRSRPAAADVFFLPDLIILLFGLYLLKKTG